MQLYKPIYILLGAPFLRKILVFNCWFCGFVCSKIINLLCSILSWKYILTTNSFKMNLYIFYKCKFKKGINFAFKGIEHSHKTLVSKSKYLCTLVGLKFWYLKLKVVISLIPGLEQWNNSENLNINIYYKFIQNDKKNIDE